MKSAFCLIFTALLSLAGSVESPSIGFARAANGTIVRVAGVSGAFITGATEHAGAISSAFSEKIGLVKFAASVRVLDGAGSIVSENDAGAGPMTFGFDLHGESAVSWSPATKEFQLYRSGVWEQLPINAEALGGAVEALALESPGRVVAVVSDKELTLIRIRISDGAVENRESLGSGGSPVAVSPSGILMYKRNGALVVRKAGVEQVIEIPDDVRSMEWMSARWLLLNRDSGRTLALRIDGEAQVYELPEVER